MKKNVFRLIILINSIALAGIIVTQIYWVREAYQMNLDQFSGSVRIAMKSVTNQMLEFQKKRPFQPPPSDSLAPSPIMPEVRHINTGLLDFKVTEEFNCMKVGENYAYAMIDLRADTVIMGKAGKFEQELIRSRHQIPMVGFRDSDHIVFSAFFPDEQSLILRRIVAWLLVSIIFTIFLVLGFYYNLFIFYKQKRLSEMKTDFINNMTHEFKTPLATISLASEMLLQKTVQQDPARSEKYSRIIYDENARLQNHVDQILRVSQLERGQFNLKKKETDLHELIRKAVENFEITVKGRQGSLKAHYCARNYTVKADPDHITNVIINLLDNANKYSPEPPDIKIGTFDSDNGVVISVEDKGIGISKENQQQIFKKLYRVPTGNLYNVKGFGIGLYYVKTIVEAHGGHIILKSDLNKGSRFDVFLPV
jgi:two-component system phosphate regulon sensor histidine kinase PhoR